MLGKPVVPVIGQQAGLLGESPDILPTSGVLAGEARHQLESYRGQQDVQVRESEARRDAVCQGTLRIFAPAARYKGKKRAAFARPSLTVDPQAADGDTKTDTDKDALLD